MNKNLPGRFLGVAAILAVAPHVHAQQAPRCSDLYDDAQRLACYDAAFGKPARPAGSGAATPRAPAATATAAGAPAAAAPAAVRAAPVAPAPPAAVSTAPAASARAHAAKPSSVSAGVTAVTRRADGRLVVTLDDGQVWSQIERDAAVEVAVGDKVTVRPGLLGSNILVTRAGVQTKVKSGR